MARSADRPILAITPRAQPRGRHVRSFRRRRSLLQGAGTVLVAILTVVVTLVLVREVVTDGPGGSPAPVALTTAGTGPPSTREPAAAWARVWTVRSGDDTFVGYRVRQWSAGRPAPTEVVGRTPAVSGTLVLSRGRLERVDLAADLTELASGDAARDRLLASGALAVRQIPTARFSLARPVTLPERPAPGSVIGLDAPGSLGLHGVARPVTFAIEGRWRGSVLEVVGRARIRLADFDIRPPTMPGVASVDDEAVIELHLELRPA